jgi:hypothetical protein
MTKEVRQRPFNVGAQFQSQAGPNGIYSKVALARGFLGVLAVVSCQRHSAVISNYPTLSDINIDGAIKQ